MSNHSDETIIICPECKGHGNKNVLEPDENPHRSSNWVKRKCIFCKGKGRVIQRITYCQLKE